MNLDYVLFPIRNLYFITYIELKYYIRCCGPLPIDVPNLAEVGDGPFHPWVRVFSSTLLAAPDPLPFAVTFSFTTVKILFFSFNLPSEALPTPSKAVTLRNCRDLLCSLKKSMVRSEILRHHATLRDRIPGDDLRTMPRPSSEIRGQ